MASLGTVFSSGASIEIDLSVRAIAAVRNPYRASDSTGSFSTVHGTRNTDPIDTLTERRFNGSHDESVSSTPSIPKAAAERKMAPTFVESTTPSITTTLLASRQMLSTLRSPGRRMAHSTPRVNVYPVSRESSSRSPVYTGMSPQRAIISAASPLMCRLSQRIDTGR